MNSPLMQLGACACCVRNREKAALSLPRCLGLFHQNPFPSSMIDKPPKSYARKNAVAPRCPCCRFVLRPPPAGTFGPLPRFVLLIVCLFACVLCLCREAMSPVSELRRAVQAVL